MRLGPQAQAYRSPNEAATQTGDHAISPHGWQRPLVVGTLTADNSGFGTLWKGVKDQDQVPGGVTVANGDGYLVTVKPAVEERPTHIEFKANDSVRAPPQ